MALMPNISFTTRRSNYHGTYMRCVQNITYWLHRSTEFLRNV